jgi:uncharacterized protein (TIGR02118 family)
MHCVKILYPKAPGSSFNLKHYLDVHVPLGLGLLAKHASIHATKVDIDVNPKGFPRAEVPYHALASVYFDKESDARGFLDIFANEEIFRQLKADFPNYTKADPEIMISEGIGVDPVSFKPI